MPVRPDAPVARVRLPGGRFAVTCTPARTPSWTARYAALGAHVAEHATVAPGPIREIYLIAPDHTDDPTAQRTAGLLARHGLMSCPPACPNRTLAP